MTFSQAPSRRAVPRSRLRDTSSPIVHANGVGGAQQPADHFVHARFLRESAAHLGLDCRRVAVGSYGGG